MSNEYFEAADKISELIGEYSEHDNVVEELKRGRTKLVRLAHSRNIIKIASKDVKEEVV